MKTAALQRCQEFHFLKTAAAHPLRKFMLPPQPHWRVDHEVFPSTPILLQPQPAEAVLAMQTQIEPLPPRSVCFAQAGKMERCFKHRWIQLVNDGDTIGLQNLIKLFESSIEINSAGQMRKAVAETKYRINRFANLAGKICHAGTQKFDSQIFLPRMLLRSTQHLRGNIRANHLDAQSSENDAMCASSATDIHSAMNTISMNDLLERGSLAQEPRLVVGHRVKIIGKLVVKFFRKRILPAHG